MPLRARTVLRWTVIIALCAQPLGCGAKSELIAATVSAQCPPSVDGAVSALVLITADDDYALFVNGALVDDRARPWSEPQLYRVQLFRSPRRRNVIAVRATNRFNQDGLDRGFIADATLEIPGVAAPVHVLSDASWRLARGEERGFERPEFDDSRWPQAIDEGPNGIAPWGPVLGASRARWLWSYVPNADGRSKPMVETVSARTTFFIALDGTVHDAPQPCQ